MDSVGVFSSKDRAIQLVPCEMPCRLVTSCASKTIIGGLLVVSELMVQLEVFAPVRSGSINGNFSNDRFGKAKGPNLVPEDHCVCLHR